MPSSVHRCTPSCSAGSPTTSRPAAPRRRSCGDTRTTPAVGAGAAPARQCAPVGARAAGRCARRLLPERRRHLGARAGAPPRSWPCSSSEPDAVREWLDQPPQTNEVGRAVGADRRAAAPAGRAPGSRAAVRDRLLRWAEPAGRPVRVRRRLRPAVRPDTAHRSASSPPGRQRPTLSPWPELRFEESAGCDIKPIDVTTTEGRLALTAYVWPDQAHRLERLRGALALAQDHPPDVRRLGAADFVDHIDARRRRRHRALAQRDVAVPPGRRARPDHPAHPAAR